MLNLYDAARRVGVPILVVRTADQAETVEALCQQSKDNPLVQWDAANGCHGLNKSGQDQLAKHKITPDGTQGFVDAMVKILALPQGTVIFALNAHRQLHAAEPISVAAAVQAVANLRGHFKQNYRMLVMTGPKTFTVPAELEQDVITLDCELPDTAKLKTILLEMQASAKKATPDVPTLSPEDLAKAVEAVSGLSEFAVEQSVAMSYTAEGLQIPALWERKRVTIEQTRGLRVYRGRERFADIVGQESVKERLRSRLKAKTPVGVVVVLDEIDKVFANVEGDQSGVKMDQMTQFLTEMENNEWRGMVAMGVAGAGKTLLGKAFGNEAGVPMILLDFGAMEGSLVGESEGLVRHAISVIKAVGQGFAYFIATSNNASIMRPEMQRRFTDGMFFFDIMSEAERLAAWKFYMKKYELAKQPLPDSDGWTGAEIRNCCRDAWDTSSTLLEAARFIVPMNTSRGDVVNELRQYAHGRFLDANKPGPYQFTPEPMQKQVRAITLPPAVAAIVGQMKES